jgi:hypothetical protein
MSQDERLAAAEAENCRLRQQVEDALAQHAVLLERVRELEGRLARDSHNSSKPPASDGVRRKTKHLRQLPAPQRAPLLARYQELLAAGLAANPPPVRRRGQRGRLAQSPARNLLERFVFNQDHVLAFLDDLTIPFDNNQAERDLRTLKVHQKVSGCFRSEPGGQAFARLRSYLATLRRQGQALLTALRTVFAGQLLYPDFA